MNAKLNIDLRRKQFCLTLLATCLLAAAEVPRASAQEVVKKLPSLPDVFAYVDRHFANFPYFQADDIISTSQVEPLFDGLRLMGWEVPAKKSILRRVASDDDFVVKQLRTDAGTKFMRQISKYPLAYDRLCHLAAIPRGRQQVYDLIRTKDGYKMIEYMTTSQQGKNLGDMLSKAPRGADFNKPVGKLFTVEALKAELEKSYQETIDAAAKQAR